MLHVAAAPVATDAATLVSVIRLCAHLHSLPPHARQPYTLIRRVLSESKPAQPAPQSNKDNDEEAEVDGADMGLEGLLTAHREHLLLAEPLSMLRAAVDRLLELPMQNRRVDLPLLVFQVRGCVCVSVPAVRSHFCRLRAQDLVTRMIDIGDFGRAARVAAVFTRVHPNYGLGWLISFLLAVHAGDKVRWEVVDHSWLMILRQQ